MGSMTAQTRQRLRRALLVAFALVCVGLWACSLNPQPIPPDDDRASGGENDGAGSGAPPDSPRGDAGDADSEAIDDVDADAGDAGDA